jgi:hypothetical protein
MKILPAFLVVLLLVPVLGQSADFESGFKTGYEDGSWEYRDYNFNLTVKSSAAPDYISGYNTGYMLAKGEPVFMPFVGNAANYSRGFETGYADGSWAYRDYNFNLSGRMKSADEGFFNGYVNGYVLGHTEKASKENNAEMQAKEEGLEKRTAALEKTNAELGKRLEALEAQNAALEKRVKDLETKTNART